MDLKICIKKERAPLFTDRKCKYYEPLYFRIPFEYHNEIDNELEKCDKIDDFNKQRECKENIIKKYYEKFNKERIRISIRKKKEENVV